ncbi:baseplate wedge subunit [Acinetobacter phage vB_AbaM_Kimel]|uniref:Baseplate wedge protein gp10 n=3 Tax=Lazarusvirus kimel TaxID=2843635 RepID=A0A6B9LN49_9CAUD|nr:baseplate wedge subunit [Acinetobacter phage vB_AbaM_Kimel]QHB48322.1 baseplate wedge protein [Acinetobacter phage vB_AbaM_Kimel]QKE55865.1 baseplate wedge protein [Acinetobacter phage Octan]QNO11284.1 baseplate wedge protein [Acinetobacter phage Meroveus]
MKELVNIGQMVDDGTGDYLREGGIKINNNFTETYDELGDGKNLHPAGAWQTIEAHKLTNGTLNAVFGKSYAVDTGTSKATIKLPKGTPADYNKVIRIRDTFSTWQANAVTIEPASGDTLKGGGTRAFSTNLTDLELVYCRPNRWEYLPNKLLNKISNGDIATVMKKEYLCTEGQTDFLNIFDNNDYNLVNTHVYLRGNLLYYGKDFSDNSDYGSPGATAGALVPLDGKSIRLRTPAQKGDSLMVVTYLDGIAQFRSTYNRLDCTILDSKLTNEVTAPGARLVADLETLDSITVEQLGYVFNSNSGLINTNTLEVYVNGVILNMAGRAGLPMMYCEGADANNLTDCQLMGGNWVTSHNDYTITTNDNGAVTSIEFGRKFEHGDIVTIKWFNNDIGTTMEIDEITDVTDDMYIQRGPEYNISGAVRVTDYTNPVLPNVEPEAQKFVRVQVPGDMFDLLYPVGTIYENAINKSNPVTYMGFGVWTRWGEKRVLVGWTEDNQDTQFGLNNNDLDINGQPTHTAGGTGGNRTITITNDNMPSTVTDKEVLVADVDGPVVIGGCQFDPDDSGPAYYKYRQEKVTTNVTHIPPKPIETLDPYITVYRWMRIA